MMEVMEQVGQVDIQPILDMLGQIMDYMVNMYDFICFIAGILLGIALGWGLVRWLR